MIYIVHGDDIVKSRFQIINQQKKLDSKNKTELYIQDIAPSDLLKTTFSSDLFGNPPFVVLNVTKAGRMNIKPFLEVILKTPNTANLIILAEKELPKSSAFLKITNKKGIKILVNKTTPDGNSFKFMDAVLYKRRNQSYKEYGKLMKEDASPFELFSKILFGLNAISGVVFKSPSTDKLHPFVKSKAIKQSEKYSKESLTKLYQDLYNLDKQIKTGLIDIDNLIPLTIEKVLNS